MTDNDMGVDFTITHESTPGQIDFIRIEARDHLKVVARLDLSPQDFAFALTGQTVLAAFTTPGAR